DRSGEVVQRRQVFPGFKMPVSFLVVLIRQLLILQDGGRGGLWSGGRNFRRLDDDRLLGGLLEFCGNDVVETLLRFLAVAVEIQSFLKATASHRQVAVRKR